MQLRAPVIAGKECRGDVLPFDRSEVVSFIGNWQFAPELIYAAFVRVGFRAAFQ